MRASTIKWIVLSGATIITIIIVMQLYWLNHIYHLEKRHFNTTVVKCIRGLFEDVHLGEGQGNHLHQSIERHPDEHSFVISISRIPEKDSLINNLAQELRGFEVFTACRVAVYDGSMDRYAYQQFIPAPGDMPGNMPGNLPVYKTGGHYLLLQFPQRGYYIIGRMDFWIFSSALLVAVLVGLAFSMFYFYRQKFLVEIQKDFVNNFTHEFKTPLAVMKIATEVLAQPGIVNQPDRMIKYATIIGNETEHLQHQVERLLQMAVSENGGLQMNMVHFEPVELIKQALVKLQPLIEDKKAVVEVKLTDDSIIFYGDKAHLELALINLIENAIKYSKKPYIIIEAGVERGSRFMSVKDNGVGIEKKYGKNIFKKFYRVPTGDVHNVKGFGLGLNFVKSIVDAHAGKITVHSVPGIGTEFRIVIPV